MSCPVCKHVDCSREKTREALRRHDRLSEKDRMRTREYLWGHYFKAQGLCDRRAAAVDLSYTAVQ